MPSQNLPRHKEPSDRDCVKSLFTHLRRPWAHSGVSTGVFCGGLTQRRAPLAAGAADSEHGLQLLVAGALYGVAVSDVGNAPP